MRRILLVVGATTALAAVGIWIRRSMGRWSGAPGAAPGRFGSWLNAYLDGPLHASVAEALEPRADDELLDVACGAGYFLARHASHVAHVAGIDLSEAKATLAREHLEDRIAAGTAEIVTGDAEALPWGDGRFTAVTFVDAFPFIPHPERALAEICRVLRPGGRAVIETGGVPDGESREAQGLAGRYWAWSDADVHRMTQSAGFEDVAIRHVTVTGDHRLTGEVVRRIFGSSEDSLVLAVKPMSVRPAQADVPTEPVAVG
jgi:SAM-dependent methyltransferase